VFHELEPPSRLVYINYFADTSGIPVPATHYGMNADWPMEARITVIFEELGGKTKLTLRHYAGRAPQADVDDARRGWGESLDRLAELLSVQDAGL
jgi:uncharacterized protein YndB with AHSA1/START domain